MSTRLLMLTLTVGAFVAVWSGDHQDSRQNQSSLERTEEFKGSAASPKLPIIHGVRVTLFWEEDETESHPNTVSDSDSTETGYSIACLPETAWMSSREFEYDDKPDSRHQHQIITSSLKTDDWDLTSMSVWSNHSELPVCDGEKTIPLSVETIPLPVDLTPGEYRIFNDAGGEYVKKWTAAELASIGIPDSVPALNSYMLEEQGRKWFYYRVNQPEIIATRLESETEEAAGFSMFSEDCDADLLVSRDPTELIVERILLVKKNLEMRVFRMNRFFSSIRLNVTSTIRKTAGSWAGMTAEALQQTRQSWERLEDISTKTESVETPKFTIRNASRFRCQRFY